MGVRVHLFARVCASEPASVVAGPALFLMSPASRGITGSVVHVDGGYHAMGAPLA